MGIWQTKIRERQGQNSQETEANKEADSHIIVIPSNRLSEAAATVKAYDDCLQWGVPYSLPIIVSIDCGPEDRDEAGAIRFPNWQQDFDQLQQMAASGDFKNDVFVITQDHNKQIKQVLLEEIGRNAPDKLPDVIPVLDELFTPSQGNNKDRVLLETIGSMVLMCDDDMRPYNLELKDMPHFFDTRKKVFFEGLEVNVGQDIHEVLSQLDVKPQMDGLKLGGQAVSPDSDIGRMAADAMERLGSETLAKRMIEPLKQDVVAAVFSILGSTVGDVRRQYKNIMFGDNAYYDDAEPTTNTTARSYPHTTKHLDKLRYRKMPRIFTPATTGFQSGRIDEVYQGIKSYLISMKLKRPLKKPKDSDRIGLVTLPITGVGDYDGADFLTQIIKNPNIQSEHEVHSLFVLTKLCGRPAICTKDYAIHAGSLGIDNRYGMGPSSSKFHTDELAWRIDSLQKGTVVAKIPFAQTQLRPPFRQGIAKICFMEEIGTIMRVMLLNNAEKETGLFHGSTQLSREYAEGIRQNGQNYYIDLLRAAEQDGISVARQRMLRTLAGDVKREYLDFNVSAIHTQAQHLMNEEIARYNRAHSVWPLLQETIRANQHRIPLLNLRTGEETNMAALLHDHEKKYTKRFSINYHTDTISNAPDGQTPWTETAEYRHVDRIAGPLASVKSL